jgi:hypothetical protein
MNHLQRFWRGPGYRSGSRSGPWFGSGSWSGSRSGSWSWYGSWSTQNGNTGSK